jgi:hypothetical protein
MLIMDMLFKRIVPAIKRYAVAKSFPPSDNKENGKARLNDVIKF